MSVRLPVVLLRLATVLLMLAFLTEAACERPPTPAASSTNEARRFSGKGEMEVLGILEK